MYPLPTRDPFGGGELVVTRLECPSTGLVLEGRFSLGWLGRLTGEQLDFVGLLLRHRNNLQKLADELGVAYNTARSRLDAVVEAVESPDQQPALAPRAPARRGLDPERRTEILERLASGEVSVDEAVEKLRG